MGKFPVILYGSNYWSGLIDWLKKSVLKEKNIDPEDMDIFQIVDSPEDALIVIKAFYSKKKKTNGKKS